jgi:hypothetical protein
MTQSKLRQVLAMFESADTPLSLRQAARDLDLPLPQLEEMIRYWVRRGKLRESAAATECGTCGNNDGACAFVVELPRSYELNQGEIIPLAMAGGSSCAHKKSRGRPPCLPS